MNYYTSKGVLEKVSDLEYKVPTRRMTYTADDIDIYCEASSNKFVCQDGEKAELDEAQLLAITLNFTIKNAFSDEDISFQYVDKYGEEIEPPYRLYDPLIDETEEDETEEEFIFDLDEPDPEESLYEDFITTLDQTRVTGFATATRMLKTLKVIYNKTHDGDTKDDMDYALEQRRRTFQRYWDGMSQTTREQIELVKRQEDGMQGLKIKNDIADLEKRYKEIEEMEVRTAKDLERKLTLRDEWLADYDKLAKEAEDFEKKQQATIESTLKKEGDKIFMAWALNKWGEEDD